jgi:hypothetical protein
MSHIDEEAARLLGAKKAPPRGTWVIYEHPDDFPKGYVARRFIIGPRVILETDEFVSGDTLHQVRALIPDKLNNVGRPPNETDKHVVEVWV